MPEATAKGGPDYGRFLAAVRTVQDHARAADAPDQVITAAADLLQQVSGLLEPYYADEWASPSGRRYDLPNRGNILAVPAELTKTDSDTVSGWVRFDRYHLGRNGAAHGGALGLLFDSVLGYTAAVLSGEFTQRTAYLHIDYRAIVPVQRQLDVVARLRSQQGRKIIVDATLFDGEKVLTEASALFLKLKPGQP